MNMVLKFKKSYKVGDRYKLYEYDFIENGISYEILVSQTLPPLKHGFGWEIILKFNRGTLARGDAKNIKDAVSKAIQASRVIFKLFKEDISQKSFKPVKVKRSKTGSRPHRRRKPRKR
jgi:hypothetical protein